MSRRLRLAANAGIVEAPGGEDGATVTYLAAVPHGPIITLAGTAQTVWSEALAGPLDDLGERVAARFGVASADVAADVCSFVADLVTARVVTIVDDPV